LQAARRKKAMTRKSELHHVRGCDSSWVTDDVIDVSQSGWQKQFCDARIAAQVLFLSSTEASTAFPLWPYHLIGF
jgi:hypothetical protein